MYLCMYVDILVDVWLFFVGVLMLMALLFGVYIIGPLSF